MIHELLRDEFVQRYLGSSVHFIFIFLTHLTPKDPSISPTKPMNPVPAYSDSRLTPMQRKSTNLIYFPHRRSIQLALEEFGFKGGFIAGVGANAF